MGKMCKWIMSFFAGRNKDNHQSSDVGENPISPMERRRWRFRASPVTSESRKPISPEIEQKNHALAVAAARAAAAEAAVAASQAADAVIRLMAAGNNKGEAAKEAAAVAVQSVFRSYLARKALRALKGVAKLQALVRGQLVRRQTTATLRRSRALRILSTHENWTFRPAKQIVETDSGEPNYNFRYRQKERKEHKLSPHRASRLHHDWQKISPPPSAATSASRRSSSWQYDDYAFAAGRSSPAVSIHNPPRTPLVLSHDYPLYPNYLADTASSRARARSQSAPRQRPEAIGWQSRRMRRPSFDTISLSSTARIQCSSSMADTAQSCQRWSTRVERLRVSPKNSECGSACSVLTDA